ncbi:preprotein translocase subunit YajC [Desulfatiferula olefinivorans]
MINVAYAMAPSQGASQSGGGLAAFVPLILMFVIFYFLLIRPQQKRAKEHQEMVNNLKKGDKVVTSGGIHGVIAKVEDTDVQLEIAEKIRIKVTRANIAVKL